MSVDAASRSSIRGNALFLILIAVALFAALSYAVTQSGRGSGSVSKEQAVLNAAQFVQQIHMYRQAFDRMRLLNGCSETQVSFELVGYPSDANPNAPADMRCHLFDPAGADLPMPPRLDASWFMPLSDTLIGGADTGYRKPWFGGKWNVQGTATAAGDLYIVVGDLTSEICAEINKRLGIPNPGGVPPVSGPDMQANVWGFPGAYTATNTFGVVGYDEGCGQANSNYTYYTVLISR